MKPASPPLASHQKPRRLYRLAGTLLLTLLLGGPVSAAWYHFSWTSGFANGGLIPDGNPAGWADTRSLTIPETQIVEVQVTLQVSGGYNGDLYGYLVHGSGFAVLLNRPGKTGSNPFGYADAGFHVTFSDTAAEPTDFHFYQTVSGYDITSGGAWRPDGRNVDPATMNGGELRTALLSSLAGPNNPGPGTWTLFLADLSYGGQSQVEQWGLSIHAVPEPTTWALGIFGALVAGAYGVRRWRERGGRV